MTMIFQDPLTSLNPVFTIGSQITESIRIHMHLPKKEAGERAVTILEKVGMPDAACCNEKISAYAFRRNASASDDRDGTLL